MKRKTSISDSALLVIDIQDSFKADSNRWQQRNNPNFEENNCNLIDAFRKAGLPVIYFLDSDGDADFQPESPFFKIMDFIKPLSSEPIIVKTSRNCFTSTDLQERLQHLGVKRISITGIKTEQCCETTARVGSDLGFEVDYITDATLTFPIRNAETREEMSADEITRRTEFALHNRFARVTNTREVLAELKGIAACTV